MRRVAVVRFPGSNCDVDALRAAEAAGADAYFVWHRDDGLAGADAVILPGGFSYGDYLRSGAIARFSPIMAAVQRHAADGGAVLGICNGFQILCEAHLLPGALMRNADLRFISRPVPVTVERTDTAFTSAFAPGVLLRLPVAHGDGRFVAGADVMRMLEDEKRVVLRYANGDPAAGVENPNGSMHDIAGISNSEGNVVGIMPHPERVIEPLLGSDDGIGFFRSLVRSAVMAVVTLALATGAAAPARAQAAEAPRAASVAAASADSTVRPGMHEAEVTAAWGTPSSARSHGNYTYLLFAGQCHPACASPDLVILERGQVVDAIARHPGHHYAGISSSADRAPAFTPSPDSGSPHLPSPAR